jgi:hypothetical protein
MLKKGFSALVYFSLHDHDLELDHECKIMIIIRKGMPKMILTWTFAPVASKITKTDDDH